MIDENWLKQLKFDSTQGVQVDGLAGIGTQKVVLNATMADGKKIVLQTYRHHLGYHIKEIPAFLTAKKEYDVDRLNKKLARLIDYPDLDEMCNVYDRLHSFILKVLHEKGVGALILGTHTHESVETIPFILQSPGVIRRLTEWSTLSEETPEDLDFFVEVNGPNFPIRDIRPSFVQWAKKTLEDVRRVPQYNPDINPSTLNKNPVYIWGAAIMDDFFTEDEFDIAKEYIEETFGRLPERKDVTTLVAQADAIAHLIAQFVKDSGEEVRRFVKFCSKLGIIFQVHDLEGNLVADGYKFAFS